MSARPKRAPKLLAALLPALLLVGGACKQRQPAQPHASPTGVVELIDAGGTPKRRLRFALAPGVRQRTSIRVEMSASAGGRRQAMPVLSGTMVTTQTPTKNPPETDVGVRFEKVELSAADGVLPAGALEKMNAKMASIGDLEGRLTLTDRGIPLGSQLNFDAVAPELRAVVQQSSSMLEAAIVPLPEEPVGTGAKWRQKNRRTVQGVEADDVTTYELLEDQGPVLRIRKTDVMSAPPQEFHLPDGRMAKLVKFASTASGSITVNLARSQPESMSVTSEITTGVQELGAPQAVEVTMFVNASTGAVDAP